MSCEVIERIDHAADRVLKLAGNPLVLATPLGLGKPNQLINALYDRAKADSKLELKIFTALSLAIPKAENELQGRFLDPFKNRLWGDDYPELRYLTATENGTLPANIQVYEFYLQAGKALARPQTQRNYVSVNYTHVPYAILDHGVQVLLQLVAKSRRDPRKYSLSCNPDLTLDVIDLYKRNGKKVFMVGVVHPDLPYCAADAEVDREFFDVLVESPEVKHKLFALPRQPISDTDHMIGLHSSLLIQDGGTLQIGIGSLSEALVYSTLLRHERNDVYRSIAERLQRERPVARRSEHLHTGRFESGLYGTSEMIMDGFMHLRRGGILKREIFDLDDSVKRWLHGAFFLGSNDFYEWLRRLDDEGERGFCMTRVSKVNDLYDPHELAIRRQRVRARFFNTCMNVTLLGGAASDTKEDGSVVSGVGGQFNFVAMSHELPDALSVLMLRSAHYSRGRWHSGFVWGQGQLTVPRHMRDVVLSEFGIAFLKNRTDEDVIRALLPIADANFQEELRQTAVKYGKLDPQWRPPQWSTENTSQWPAQFLAEYKKEGLFPAFPFGSDFTPVEERLALALTKLKSALRSKSQLVTIFLKGAATEPASQREALERMALMNPRGLKDRLYRRLLLGAL